MVNKYVASYLSPEAAIILAELIAEYCLWEKKGQLTPDGFFFCTVEKLEKILQRKWDSQNAHINKLIKNKLVIKEVKGEPKKRYFKLNFEVISLFYQGKILPTK